MKPQYKYINGRPIVWKSARVGLAWRAEYDPATDAWGIEAHDDRQAAEAIIAASNWRETDG